jgi:hypothetical protein
MLHLFTATNNALWLTIGQALLLTFWFCLNCYPDGSLHRFTMCCWTKSYQKCWRKSQSRETCGSSTMGLQLTLHIRSENISPPLTMFAGLDGLDKDLASQVTRPHTTLKPWFIHHQLILKKILLPYCWSSSSHQAVTWHFRAYTSVAVVFLSAVSRAQWPYVWTSTLFGKKYIFFFWIFQ